MAHPWERRWGLYERRRQGIFVPSNIASQHAGARPAKGFLYPKKEAGPIRRPGPPTIGPTGVGPRLRRAL